MIARDGSDLPSVKRASMRDERPDNNPGKVLEPASNRSKFEENRLVKSCPQTIGRSPKRRTANFGNGATCWA